MKNVAVMPFYYCFDEERAEITRKIFHHYANVERERGDIVFFGIGSEGDVSHALWGEHHDLELYAEYSQDGWPEVLPSGGSTQIRAKFNYSIQHAPVTDDTERVWLIQSDDLITANFFEPSNADLVGVGPDDLGACYFWRRHTDEYVSWNGQFPYLGRDEMPFCGGNIGYSREFLDDVNWEPYTFENDEMGLQKFAKEVGRTFDARTQTADDFRWWLIKGQTCLNPWWLFKEFAFQAVPAHEIDVFRTYWESL